LQGSPRQYDIITGEPPPPKVAGSVNLYTEEFFSLMNSRLKQGGIATFWLPVDQLKVSEAKAILRAFRNAFPNASVWAGADEEWIIAGHQGASEVPEQLGALFLMDGEEIGATVWPSSTSTCAIPACAFRFWKFWAATNSASPLQKQSRATQKYRRRKQCRTW